MGIGQRTYFSGEKIAIIIAKSILWIYQLPLFRQQKNYST